MRDFVSTFFKSINTGKTVISPQLYHQATSAGSVQNIKSICKCIESKLVSVCFLRNKRSHIDGTDETHQTGFFGQNDARRIPSSGLKLVLNCFVELKSRFSQILTAVRN